METQRLSLKFEGPPDADGMIDADGFHAQLGAFLSAAKGHGADLCNGKRADFRFRIVSMKMQSPAVVGLETIPKTEDGDHALLALRATTSALAGLSGGVLSEYVPNSVLENYKKLAAPLGGRISQVTVAFDDIEIVLTEQFKDNLRKALKEERSCRGSYRGCMEFLNIHADKKVFRIYPDLGPGMINCLFSEDQYSDAIASVGKQVEVHGTLRFRSASRYPFQIDVETVSPLPESGPKLSGLRGLAAGFRPGVPSEDIVAEVRGYE
jgi:hypothetical protein